ncbi:MAG: FMN-binding protein [Peptostreptococcaceae bacterium]|nr:FMN-binding protein [Peptostreptococcaceae bacterium]MDY5739156.1 FMN-binding protein [Anaerovoracaceae bacterium]SFE31829.1 electron transport complex protein RnfG [Peptostreptococcaceae bacterium pGA-8]
MKNNNTFKEYVAPIVVLVAICLVITAALAATYGVAKPIIDTNSKKAADQARTELLPEADAFTAYDGELVVAEEGKVFVEDCYVADNKTGVVITVKTKSFGGLLTEMIGIDKDGKITGVKVTNHADTPGLGTKAHTEEHLKQYKGIDKLTSPSAKDEPAIDHITGATISSNGVHFGVYAALEQFNKMGGIK